MTGQGGTGPADQTLASFNLTFTSVTALERTADLTGDKRVDVVNRALQVYAEVAELAQHEGAYWLRVPEFDARGDLHLFVTRTVTRQKRRWWSW